MIVVIYKGKGREGTKQVPFTSKSLAIKKAKDLYKKGYCNVKVSEISIFPKLTITPFLVII